jgi:hypothetical protein
VIAIRQPINLGEISSELGIPRSSSHRAVSALVDYGWVTKRTGDQAYVMSARFSDQFGTSENGLDAAANLRALMLELYSREYLYSELSVVDPQKGLSVVESTYKQSYKRGAACDEAQSLESMIDALEEPIPSQSNTNHAAIQEEHVTVLGAAAKYGAYISNQTLCVLLKSPLSGVGVLSIWPVRKFSNSLSQIERVRDQLRGGQVFSMPQNIDLFYTGVTK